MYKVILVLNPTIFKFDLWFGGDFEKSFDVILTNLEFVSVSTRRDELGSLVKKILGVAF